ncbi:MAG: hypothetical protein KY443_06260 [Actinobacteria bacterium]|nr:hypothetical protein [Actinomycetota bacterium]
MRRGASFEGWLRNRGLPADIAEKWAGHAVWASGYAAGRWGKLLVEATSAELQAMADSGLVDWQEAAPAVAAWFDWLRPPSAEAPNPVTVVRHPSTAPRLRLLQSNS